jgi:hypothetical protein
MILGIAGKMEAGKSSLARYISTKFNDVVIAPFASAVRSELIWAIDDDNLPEDAPPDVKDAYDKLRSMSALSAKIAINDKPTHPAARVMLQWWGTDYRRKQDADYWVKKFDDTYKKYVEDPLTLVVVDDVRFPNEVAYVNEKRGHTLWLERKTTNDASHASENSITYEDCDVVINSNCALINMCESAEVVVKGYLK